MTQRCITLLCHLIANCSGCKAADAGQLAELRVTDQVSSAGSLMSRLARGILAGMSRE